MLKASILKQLAYLLTIKSKLVIISNKIMPQTIQWDTKQKESNQIESHVTLNPFNYEKFRNN